jgi:hypothetical protein
MSDRNVSATRRVCSSGVRKLTNVKLKKCTDRMFPIGADEGKDSTTFAPLIVVPPVQNRSLDSSLRANLGNAFWWIVLDEAIPEKYIRAKLKNSITVSESNGTEGSRHFIRFPCPAGRNQQT